MQRKEPYATQEELKEHVIHYPDVLPIPEPPGATHHFVVSEKVMIMFVTGAPNSIHAPHRHESEQITIVLDGAVDFILDGKLYPLEKGDGIIAPPNIEHGIYVSDKGASSITVFSPPLLERIRKYIP